MPGVDAALHRHGNMPLPSWVKIVCVDINPAVATAARSRYRSGCRRCDRRRPVPGAACRHDCRLFPASGRSGMKGEYTEDHAASGVDAPLPEIETWPNQYRTGYEIEIEMPGVHCVSQDRPARPWNPDPALFTRQAMSGIEVAEDVHASLPELGNFSGEHRQSDGGRCGSCRQSSLGNSGSRLHAARGHLYQDHPELEAETKREDRQACGMRS